MQAYAEDGTRLERTGWRDQALSERHRLWGVKAPMTDIDFLALEYNFAKPVALVEYKHHMATMPNLNDSTYLALRDLADHYIGGNTVGLPFMIVFYWPDIWAFRVWPVNDMAKKEFTYMQDMTEVEWVIKLHTMRRQVLARELGGKLLQNLPPKPNGRIAEPSLINEMLR